MAIQGAMQFLHEVKSELLKVVWPKLDEFIGSTAVVLIVMSLYAIYLGVIDLGFAQLAKYLFKLYGMY